MSYKSGYAPKGRKDANHALIVEVFEKAGWKVLDTSALGRGAPDLLVRPNPIFSIMWFIEIKRDGKSKLKPGQKDFAADGWPVVVLNSVDQALAFVGR